MIWKKRMFFLLTVVLLLSVFLVWQNNDLVTTRYEHTMGLEEEMRIVHLSDLHSKTFGQDSLRLVENVLSEAPDMIVITGDLIDQNDKQITNQLDYIETLTENAPVYIVSGNHEYWAGLESEVRETVENLGAYWMDNKALTLNVNGNIIQLIGLSDPEAGIDIKNAFQAMHDEGLKTLVLAHRATSFKWLKNHDVSMVFSGHTHGGQVRLPFIGGLYGPDQGFNPAYTSGLYQENETTLVMSRGLGNSVFPFRVFNRPHIVSVRLN